jgi:DNA-binding response OmpR family regulator
VRIGEGLESPPLLVWQVSVVCATSFTLNDGGRYLSRIGTEDKVGHYCTPSRCEHETPVYTHTREDVRKTTAGQSLAAANPEAQCRGSDSAHVLIVDDDLGSVGLVIAYLRDYDFAITTATNGGAGFELARKHRPDLILLDLWMPVIDGFEVLGRLKALESTRDIPVLLLSARADLDCKVRGFELGAADYLTKPIAEAELHARVTVHLRRQRLMSALEQRLRAYEQRYGGLDAGATADAERFQTHRQEVARLYRARQLLRERLAQPPTLNELAQLLGTNQPRLSRGFRALFGTTVFGFIREARLQRARELLIETSWPVKSIALEVGYRNTGDLTRGIKERFGMTPSELRERL